jgi:hypothetical protein
MHKKEFWILTNKCGNKLKHENEAEGPRGAMAPTIVCKNNPPVYGPVYWFININITVYHKVVVEI